MFSFYLTNRVFSKSHNINGIIAISEEQNLKKSSPVNEATNTFLMCPWKNHRHCLVLGALPEGLAHEPRLQECRF